MQISGKKYQKKDLTLSLMIEAAKGCLQVYKGKDEILLSKLILEPQHSVLRQSYDCRLRMVCIILQPCCKNVLKSYSGPETASQCRWIWCRILHAPFSWPRALHLYLHNSRLELHKSGAACLENHFLANLCSRTSHHRRCTFQQ